MQRVSSCLRVFFCLFLVVGLVFAGGCQVMGPNGQVDQTQTLLQNEIAIEGATSLASNIALLQVKEADRVQTARMMYEVASAIQAAAANGNVDVSQLNTLAQNLLANWNSPYKLAVGALVSTASQMIQLRVDSYLSNASAKDKAATTIALINAVVSGIKNTSMLYTQGVPSGITSPMVVKPVAGFSVRPMLWTTPATP